MAGRKKTLRGVIPSLLSAVWKGLRWLILHPQWLVTLSVLAGIGWGAGNVIAHSDAFRVTEIQLPPKSPLKVPKSSLVGRNIWAVDIESLAQDLKAQQPHLKELRVVRMLPQTLRVETVERTPVAQVLLRSWHPVDRDGYILPASGTTPAEGLVILRGVEDSKSPLAPGKTQTGARVMRALKLIDQLRGSSWLLGHQLSVVDAADPEQITFVLDQGMEIRCGSQTRLTQDLKRLKTVLQQVAKRELNVRYIDLRFQDPVIGPK
jgi:cell division septal protein FtsQ